MPAQSIETLNHKVVENTVAPMLPPVTWARNPSLSLAPSEREVLFKCLKAEYAENSLRMLPPLTFSWCRSARIPLGVLIQAAVIREARP